MASNLRVDQILPTVGTNVAIGTATGTVTLAGTTSGTFSGNLTGNATGLSGSPTLSGITSVSTTNLTVNGNAYPSDGVVSGARNRIINGDMRIDQRNAGASVTLSGDAYTLDRWRSYAAVASKLSAQQSSTAPAEFINSALYTSLAATTPGTTDRYAHAQFIEGLNVSDLAWGTASAKTVTLSFWVRSSLTGTFGGALSNNATDRSYPFTYSISADNTWEQKSVTIAGDTSGTWLTTSGVGIRIWFSLGAGPDRKGTAGAWAGANYISATGATDVVATNGATFYITGVQLEVGTVATPFEKRSYGQELALCQRYYYKFISNTSSANVLGVGFNESTTLVVHQHYFPVSMRTNPTAIETSGTAGHYGVRTAGSTVITASAVPAYSDATTVNAVYTLTVASGLTAGQASLGRVINTSGYLAWSAEL